MAKVPIALPCWILACSWLTWVLSAPSASSLSRSAQRRRWWSRISLLGRNGRRCYVPLLEKKSGCEEWHFSYASSVTSKTDPHTWNLTSNKNKAECCILGQNFFSIDLNQFIKLTCMLHINLTWFDAIC